MVFDAFISYSTKDKQTADAACAALEKAGIRCWIAPRDIRPGLEWDAAIVDAIDQCKVMVLIFSASANESQQVRREVKHAFSKSAPVIPLRIEAIVPTKSMAYYMDSVHWLDAMTPPLEQHLTKLADTAKAFLQADAAIPDAASVNAQGGIRGTQSPGQAANSTLSKPTSPAALGFSANQKVAAAALAICSIAATIFLFWYSIFNESVLRACRIGGVPCPIPFGWQFIPLIVGFSIAAKVWRGR